MDKNAENTCSLELKLLGILIRENANVLGYLEKKLSVSIEVFHNDAVVSGDALEVENAVRILSEVEHFSADIVDINFFTVRYLTELSINRRLDDIKNFINQTVYHTPKGVAIRTKTLGQGIYIHAMSRSDLVFCIGPAGSGKTFLGVAMAVKALRDKDVSRIILTRPAVEAGEQLGFLPGDIQEKVDPYMRPIFDALRILLGDDVFQKYYDKGTIEVSPLAFMRGRTLDDAFILLDEAQNTTIEQMKMFLTRIGFNSKTCVCGDITQIDLPRGVISGLSDAVDLLHEIENIEIVKLSQSDIVRNPLVGEIVNAYEKRKLTQGV